MIYNFDIKVAKEYGVNEAIMIANFQHWISKNKANQKNFFDGRYWTYNSKKAFLELFPFWSEQNIKTILNHLKDKGVLKTGNYNKSSYDRTLWYAFVNENQWISENQPIQKLELTNGKVKTNQAIPDNKPYIEKPNNKPNKEYIVFGEFKNVKLTLEQVKKLINDYEWYFEDAIEALSSYLEFKGDKYKSHYAVLGKTNWVWEKVHKNPDCGIRPVTNMFIDPTNEKGGLRKETAWEYYSKKYSL